LLVVKPNSDKFDNYMLCGYLQAMRNVTFAVKTVTIDDDY